MDYNSGTLKQLIDSLLSRYEGRKIPKILTALERENSDMPIDEMDTHTIMKYGNKLYEQLAIMREEELKISEEGVVDSPEEIETEKSIDILYLSNRSRNALLRWGINTIGQLKALSYEEICSIRGLGANSIQEIIEKLNSLNESGHESLMNNPVKEYPFERAKGFCVDVPIEAIDFSVRASNCLKSAEIKTVNQLAEYSVDDLFIITGIGKSTVEEILEKTKAFIEENSKLIIENQSGDRNAKYSAPYIRYMLTQQIKEVLFDSGFNGLSVGVIQMNLDNYVPDTVIRDIINELMAKGIIKIDEDSNVHVYYKSILDVIKQEKQDRSLQMTLDYFEGMSLTEIGEKYEVTKQNVDQVCRRVVKSASKQHGRLKEDEYKYFYETYNVKIGGWNNFVGEPEYVFRYLKLRYESGGIPVNKAREDELVPEFIRENIRLRVENIAKLFEDAHKKSEAAKAKEIKKTEKKPVNPEKGIRFVTGTIGDLVLRYEALYEKEKTVVLYSDKETFEKQIVKLKKRVARELKNKKYISDVRINKEEYEMLKNYLHYAIQLLKTDNVIADKDLFITAVVNVAIIVYKGGNFWGNFFGETSIKQSPQLQTLIGNAYYLVLKERDMIRVDRSQPVQNILLHCFISNNYADGYFEFLYDFYRIDLDRDIERLDRDTMQDLMESIVSSAHLGENEGRAYKLVKHIGQSMEANQRGAKTRIRCHLKLMDRFFWDTQYEIKTTHRIKRLLQEWVKDSDRLKSDIEEYKTGRASGRKRFSSPYIALNEAEDTLRLVLPSQNIKEYDTYNISWHVYGKTETVITAELTDSVLGFKVLESEIEIAWEDALDEYKIELSLDTTGEVVKRFQIKQDSVRLFDENGYPVNSSNIKVGDVISVSRAEDTVDSSALYDTRKNAGMLISYFQFEYEDIVKLPDGHVVIVGKREITNSIAGKGKVEGARCEVEEKEYHLYGKIPYLVLRMKAERANGTSITINGEKYRLTSLKHEKFSLDDRTGDVGYYMNLETVISENEDNLYRIEVDIPNTTKRAWSFVYIRNFEVKFDEAPYIFEPRGTAGFPEHVIIKEIEDGCEKEAGINAYKFEIKTVNRTLDFVTVAGDKDVLVNIEVPAFFVKRANGEWDSNRLSPIWHDDLPDILELAVPHHKISLYIEEDTDEETEIRELEFRKNVGEDYIKCDITKFKSYLNGDADFKPIGMRFEDTDEKLVDVMIHDRVVSCQLIGDFKENALIINTTVIGKAPCCVDISKDGDTIAEKLPIVDEKARTEYEIQNGRYDIELFEMMEDDSGFGEVDYYSIGKYNQLLLNPYDMTGRSFEIKQIEKRENSEDVLPLRYQYYVENLEKTEEEDVYEGRMVVEKGMGHVKAALPVRVTFEDIDNPNYVWVAFLDEYNDEADFLYDTRKKGILQEENSRISKLKCYRRYSMLDIYEDIFHIDFCEREERDYDDVDEAIVFSEDSNVMRFRSTSKHHKREKKISDITWSKIAFACINRTGYTTLEQMSDRTRAEFMRKSGAPEDVVEDIENIMNFYGYRFAKKSKSQRAVPTGAVAMPKTHGIKVADIKWRNARVRACLDRAGIYTLDRIAMMTKEEFSELKSVNEDVIKRVEEILKQYGYKFK